MVQLYFEDFTVGQTDRFGECRVERDEVIAFARKYDPQPFHIDDAAAAANPVFGRISASAIHVLGMVSRMLADRAEETGFKPVVGLGMQSMRNIKPVYPGDTLTVETVIEALRRSASRPDLGIVTQRVRAINQDGQVALEFVGVTMFPVRARAT